MTMFISDIPATEIQNEALKRLDAYIEMFESDDKMYREFIDVRDDIADDDLPESIELLRALMYAPDVPTVDDLAEQLGEGMHTAFRKAVDNVEAHRIWMLIGKLPPEDWAAIVNFVAEGAGMGLGLYRRAVK